jgi:MFS family permease
MISREALHRLGCGLTGAILGLSQSLGLYLVSSNLANIQGSIGATAAEAGWLTTAYFGAALSSAPLVAKIRLHIGLHRFATIGLLCFVGASALHLTTNTVPAAVLARALLGTTAPVVSTLAVFYLLEAFSPKRPVAGILLGFCSLQIGLPLSRVISTNLLELGQWHGLFLIDVALALISLAAIHVARIPDRPPQPSLNRGDLVIFPLYAIGLALLSIAVSQGRQYWWTDTDWIGECLVASIALIGLYVVIDLGRPQPLLDLRWLARPYMIRFVAAVLLFRIVLSEQTVGIVGLMSVLGQSNEQMERLFSVATLAVLVGFVISIAIAAKGGTRVLAMIAVMLIITAACLDSTATSLTRPEQLYFSQALLSAGLAMFFAGAVLLGFGPVLADGGKKIASFLAAFTFAQYLGFLLGSAWVSTTVAQRQQLHYLQLVQHITYGDPLVASRVAQLSGSVARVVTDAAARTAQGGSLLSQQVTRESFVLAYQDVFIEIAEIGCAMFVGLAIISWQASRRAKTGAAAKESANEAVKPAV